jgi:hypothetical protein
MRKTSIILAAAAVIGFAGIASAASYSCVKAKTLKTPTPTIGVESNVDPEVIGAAQTCTKYKLATVCFPSSVGEQVATNTDDGQCCFKAKCAPGVTELSGLAITTDNADGGGGPGASSFSVDTKKKISNVCVPCDVQ